MKVDDLLKTALLDGTFAEKYPDLEVWGEGDRIEVHPKGDEERACKGPQFIAMREQLAVWNRWWKKRPDKAMIAAEIVREAERGGS